MFEADRRPGGARAGAVARPARPRPAVLTRRLVGAGAVALLLAGSPLEAQPPLEFHLSYRPAAFDALRERIAHVSLVVAEWYTVDGEGALSGEAEARVLELARRHGVPVMAQVKNLDREAGLFRADWAHRLVSTPEARRRAIRRMVELCERHDLYGFQIELEGVHVRDRDGISLFVREAADALHRAGYRLSVSAVHREEDGPGPTSYTAWMWERWRGAYDLAALGEAADFVRAVAYAEHTRRTPPGPSQSLPWLERVLRRFLREIPPEKLTVDLFMGGMHWYAVADPELYHVDARSWSRRVSRAEALELLRRHGGTPLLWDDRRMTSYGFLERAGVYEWLFVDDDVRAFQARLDLLRSLGIGSVALWLTGEETPGMWGRFTPHPMPPRDPAGAGQAARERPELPPPGGIPVLAWHYFAERLGPDDGPLTDTYGRLERILAFLSEHGFRSVFSEEARLPGRGGDGREVVLTFDDGRKGTLEAAELLERHGFKGVFFVIPDRTTGDHAAYLSPDEIERLTRAGHRVAAHGYEHLSLATSGAEMAGSLAAWELLRDRLEPDPSPLDFAMPFGHYAPEVLEALETRYRYLHTVNPGYWDAGSATVPRMLVMSDNELGLYEEYLLGGSGYAPVLAPLTPDGAVADTVVFRIEGPLPPQIELLSVSPDATGRSYARHPLEERARVEDDRLVLDLAAHLGRWYAPDRRAIAYALVEGGTDRLRFLSPGLLHWIAQPATGPRLVP